MSKPKCPRCDTNEYVYLVKTFTKVGGVAGGAAGGIKEGKDGGSIFDIVVSTLFGAAGGAAVGNTVDRLRGLYQCNKCDCEFEGDVD